MRIELSKNYSWFFLCCIFALFGLYTFFSITLNSPILASDEYAYFISGKYLNNLDSLYKLDPYLQQISNLLYFKIVSVIKYFFGPQMVVGLKLLHVVEYFLTVIIFYKTFQSLFERSALMLGALGFTLLTTAVYIYAIMPEVELILSGACLAYSLIVIFPKANIFGSILAGAVIGIAIMIKPHAIALFCSALATVMIYPFVMLDNKNNYFSSVRNGFIFVLASYIVFIFIWRLSASNWSFDPRSPLGLQVYGQFIDANATTSSVFDRLIDILKYVLIHLLFLFFIFSPVFFWIVRFSVLPFKKNKSKETFSQDAQKKFLIAFFILTVVFSHVFMIAYFTSNVGAHNEFEKMRVHGRYLGIVIGVLTFFYFYAVEQLSQKLLKIISVINIVTLFVFIVAVRSFKIYPWDYPLLFAFFDPHNSYGWSFSECFTNMRSFLLASLLIFSCLAIFKEKWRKQLLALQLFLILICASVQTHNWIFSHLALNQKGIETSKAMSLAFTDNLFGKGVVVTSERFGSGSYVLFNLANAPKVLTKGAGSVIEADDIAGANWVLFAGPYTPNFYYKNKISSNGLDFYSIDTNILISNAIPSKLKANEKLKILLGKNQNSSVQLGGFNEIEEWGAWTSDESAEIVLPVELSGHVKIQLFGWILHENDKKIVRVDIGDSKTQIAFLEAGSIYTIDAVVGNATNKIILNSATIKPESSHRKMGVAVSYLIIESL